MLLQMKVRVRKLETICMALNFLSKNLIQKFWSNFTGDLKLNVVDIIKLLPGLHLTEGIMTSKTILVS